MEIFAFLGLFIAVTIAIFGVTALLGWINDDCGDYSAHWFMTCVLYAVTVTLLIMRIRALSG